MYENLMINELKPILLNYFDNTLDSDISITFLVQLQIK